MVRKTSSEKTASKKKSVKKVKKRVSKKTPRTKSTKVYYHSTKEIKVERALIENFIGLQKVMVHLSGRFDELSTQISRLLNLFEVSAKAMAKKEFSRGQDPDLKKVLDRLDNLTQQAGLIGRGLALIHEVNEEKHGRSPSQPQPMNFEPRPSPIPKLRNPNLKPTPPQGQGSMEMQPSIMKPSSAPVSAHTPQRIQKTPKTQIKEIGKSSVHEADV